MPKTRRKTNRVKHKARVRAVSKRLDAQRKTEERQAQRTTRVSAHLYTDYPFTELGDVPWQAAPIREVTRVLSYDGDKYCRVLIDGRELDVKAGYIYRSRPVPGVTPEPVSIKALSIASRV